MGLAVHAAHHANTTILTANMQQHFCKNTSTHLHSHFADREINSVFRKPSGESKPSDRIAHRHWAQGLGSRMNLSSLATSQSLTYYHTAGCSHCWRNLKLCSLAVTPYDLRCKYCLGYS